MGHDELERVLNKTAASSSVRSITAMTSIPSSLADTIRALEASGAMKAFRDMEDRHKSLIATMALPTETSNIGFLSAGTLRQLAEMEEQNRRLLESFRPHVEAMERANRVFRDSSVFKAAQSAVEALGPFETRFRLPVFHEYAGLAAAFAKSPAVDALSALSRNSLDLEAAMGMRSAAWLSATDAMRSIGAVAELHGIGKALGRMTAFDDMLASGLRTSLGDWRDPIDWPRGLFSDLAVRTNFYEGLGFNPALTEFPDAAFEEGLHGSGIQGELPPLLVVYEPPVPPADGDADEEGFSRTNQAHDWLQRLESQLRSFIDARMTALFGPEWPRRRLPNGMYEQWLDKQRKAKQAGCTERSLIAYADFRDYEPLICKRDNWKDLFAAFFARPESVRESFQRLYPIRLDTMHARAVTHDDALLLYVEARRLMKMIGGH